jgi:hypothetical protein
MIKASLMLLLSSACRSSSPASHTPPTASASVTAATVPQVASPRTDAGEEAPIALDAQTRVATFLGRVAAVRELAAKASVEARVLDRDALLKRVRDHVEREVPADVLVNQGEFLIGFGWVPPAYDVEEGMYALLGAQLAGFYEPSDKFMYLAADLAPSAADATLAHELVHALQDQHFNLGSRLTYQPEANDRLSALQGLAEGDATSAMADLMLSEAHRRSYDVPDELFATQVESSMTSTKESASVPPVLRHSLAVPYIDGTAFVNRLRRRELQRGGSASGWKAVDDAWKALPETTEQLLHLEKFDVHEPAERLDPMPAPAAQGWTVVYDDVLGEQGLRIGLREWLGASAAAAIASGWGGDRARVFRDAGLRSVAWQVRYDAAPGRDADAYAKRAYTAVAQAIAGSGRKITGAAACRERDDLGPLAVRRTGRDLALVAGPYRREGERVMSQSGCAQANAWSAAILSKHSH